MVRNKKIQNRKMHYNFKIKVGKIYKLKKLKPPRSKLEAFCQPQHQVFGHRTCDK